MECGGIKYFGELRGGAKLLKVQRGGGSENLVGYSTANMHVNTMAQSSNRVGVYNGGP